LDLPPTPQLAFPLNSLAPVLNEPFDDRFNLMKTTAAISFLILLILLSPLAGASDSRTQRNYVPDRSATRAMSQQSGLESSVELPFGFEWGQNREDVRHLLAGVGVSVISRQKVGPDREVWALRGFIKPLLQGTKLYFTGDFMEEIELQFGSETWGEDDYIRLRRKLVGQLNRLYGSNRMIGSDTSRDEGIAQSLIGYEWLTRDTRLRVIDFSASKEGDLFRRVSVHYRFYDRYEVADGQ
jgi:hypothetical protein